MIISRRIIITMFTAFALFISTQCKLANDESNDLGAGSPAVPVSVIPTTSATNLISEISSYDNYSLLNGLTVQGVKKFNLLNITGTAATADISGDTALTTELGLLVYRITTADSGTTGKIWLNGSLIEASGTNTGFFGRTTFSPGINYIAFVIYQNGVAIGRSNLVKITSNVKASLYRFELIWDGNADLDLHLASSDWNISSNAGAWHVYYNDGSTTHTATGYDIDLDTDSDAYGPENIRIYSIPAGTDFKCWIDYHSGSGAINLKLNLYKDNSLIPDHKWEQPISYGEKLQIGTWTSPNTLPNSR